MKQEINQPAEDASAAAKGRRRSRRSTAAPATLRRAAELIQSAPSTPRKGSTPSAEAGSGLSQPAGGSPLPQLAREDDPRAWGDRPDDSADWLREQRPPHWG